MRNERVCVWRQCMIEEKRDTHKTQAQTRRAHARLGQQTMQRWCSPHAKTEASSFNTHTRILHSPPTAPESGSPLPSSKSPPPDQSSCHHRHSCPSLTVKCLVDQDYLLLSFAGTIALLTRVHVRCRYSRHGLCLHKDNCNVEGN